jgi:cytochrome c-type biogenesis protein CcmH
MMFWKKCHREERSDEAIPQWTLARLLRFARNGRAFLPLLFLLVTIVTTAPAYAVRPDEMLPDPALEARAREVGQELRCLVCRNQSIDDSDADLAHDLRVLVRDRIKAGDSNNQVVAYIRARYGDFVLLRPPFELDTVLLWGGPALILLLGAFGIHRYYRHRRRDEPPPLSAEERRRLKSVLDAAAEPEARA